MSSGLRWYLVSTACALVPAGVQLVLFPYLLVVRLEASPARMGLAQMAAQLPMLLLMLFGGLLGDRFEQRRLLVVLHGAMALLPLALAALIRAGQLGYPVLLGWAVASGVLAALALPPRDALLNRVAGDDVQRGVAAVVGVQLAAQVLGFVLGSGAERAGVVPLLLTQSGVLVAAMLTTALIPADPQGSEPARAARPGGGGRAALTELAEALVVAGRSPLIAPALVLAFAVGLLFAGTFMVLLPLMVRNFYAGGSMAMGAAFGAALLGAATSVVALLWRGAVARPGRPVLVAGGIGSLALGLLALELPAVAFYAALYLWGAGGGISVALSRGIVQAAAPEAHRARLLALFALGVMGGVPLGSLLAGWCAELLGLRGAVLVPVGGMLLVLVTLRLGSRLWWLKQPGAEPAPA